MKNPIRIGNQTAFSAVNIEDPFFYAVLNGFNAFEWFPDKKETGAGWTIQDIIKDQRHLLRDMATEHDIRISVHTACDMDLLQTGSYVLLRDYMAFTIDMGGSLMNIHLQGDQGIDAYLDAVRPLIKDLAGHHISLAIENTPLTTPEDFNTLFRQIRRLDGKDYAQVGMCFDMGHANLCSTTHNDYLRFLHLLDPEIPITHAHLHENNGDYDSHLPLFTGPSEKDPAGVQGLLKQLNQRHFSGCLILEQWPQQPSLLNETRNRLLTILNEN